MRLRYRISFIGISFLIIFFSSVYAFLVFQGKIAVIRLIENLTGRQVSLSYFDIKAPLNLEIKGLDIQGLGTVESVFISPSLLRLLVGQVALNKVIISKPRFKYERMLPQPMPVENSTKALAAQGMATQGSSVPISLSRISNFKKQHHIKLILKQVKLEDGKLDYVDRTVGKSGIALVVKDLTFDLTNFCIPARSVVTSFSLKGLIPWEKGKEEGKIEAAGWINLGKKDIDIKVKISDIDGIYLYPYYSNWVDLEKARIEKAKLNFNSNIRGSNNNLTAECHLELTDIVRKALPPGQSDEKAAKITDRVLDIFKALDQGKIVLDFTIRTKMTRPEFGFGDIKMAFQEKLEKGAGENNAKRIMLLPANLVEGTVKTATNISKAVLDGTFAIGNELKKAVKGIFKK